MATYFYDRLVEHPGRIRLTATSDQDVYDVSREEGTIYDVGTPLNATNLNGAYQDVIDQIPTKTSDLTNDSGYVASSSLADYVVQQGTSGMWTYRKWNSGIMECWGTYSDTIAITTAATAYGGYRSALITADAFPYAFDAKPVVIGLSMTGSGVTINNATDTTTTNAKFYLACGSSTASKTMAVALYAVGTYS